MEFNAEDKSAPLYFNLLTECLTLFETLVMTYSCKACGGIAEDPST